MDYSTEALAHRTMSAFALSIGTSLALETLFAGPQAPYDPERVMPPHVDLSQYEVFYVNIMTLYRNIIGSIDKQGAEHLSPGDVLSALTYEIDLIKHVVAGGTFGKTKVIFYASNYKHMAVHFPYARLRVDSTVKQKEYSATMQQVLNAYFKEHPVSEYLQLFDLLPRCKEKKKGLILTHYAIDLLSWPSFSELSLLESHTGLVKERSAWYTKLTNGKDLLMIPFSKVMLQVFGDSQSFFSFPIKVREQVLDLAKHYHWNATTTPDRMILGFSSMSDKFTGATLKSMV